MNKLKSIYLVILLLSFVAAGCEDNVTLEEENSITPEDALKSINDYELLLNSAYDVLRGNGGSYLGGRKQVLEGLLSREFEGDLTGDYQEVFRRNTGFFNGTSGGYYSEAYTTIYRANVLLSEIDNVQGQTEQINRRIKGEALFLRAISHFNVMLYFAQPYGFTADNSHSGIVIRTIASPENKLRSTLQESYEQIESDLLDAVEFLSNGNDRGFGFADEYAAKAYLARLYFYTNQYEEAYDMANDVIENSEASFDSDITVRFSQGLSNEGVFVMPSINNQDNRGTGLFSNFNSLNVATNPPPLRIAEEVYELVADDENDIRNNWFLLETANDESELIYLTKYNTEFFDVPLIHITELKLIRAESAALINQNLDVAIQDINDIRERAFGNSDENLSSTATAQAIVQAARLERRIELIAEGAYLHDMKRIGVLEGNVLIEGAEWNCPGLLLEFPALEQVEGFVANEPNGC